MRYISLMVAVLALAGCDFVDGQTSSAVDPAKLAPLSSREQALIFGADGAMQQKNYAAAERDYLGAVAESKGRVEAHIALAHLYEKQGQVAKEKEILIAALKLQPNHPFANYLLGKLYLSENLYADALAAFQHGRVTMPDDSDLTMGEAVTQDMLGRHTVAQRLYSGLLRGDSPAKMSVVRTNLAMSYLLSNEPQKAVDLLKDEGTKTGASPVTRHNLALAYGLLGRNGDAKALLNGEVDEETRMLAVGRMRAYHQDRLHDGTTPPLQPTITEVVEPPEPPISRPVIVENKEKAVKPAAVKAPAPAPKAVESVKPAPAKVVPPKAERLSEPDPNYIPGLTDVEDEDADASVSSGAHLE